MSDLFNIPDKDRCGVYTITNRRTGKKYIGSSTQLKKRAEVHKGEIARRKHNNRSIQQEPEWQRKGVTKTVTPRLIRPYNLILTYFNSTSRR